MYQCSKPRRGKPSYNEANITHVNVASHETIVKI